MSAQDLGTLSDYILNGDNYTRVDPATGNTLIIPGQQNSTGKPLLAPNSECNAPDCYYPIVPSCAPPEGFSGRCDLVVHDRITGWYHISAFSDFQSIDVTCECSLAQGVTGFTPPNQSACVQELQNYVDSLDGLQIWGVTAPWLLAELGLPRNTPFFADFWFIACNDPPLIIPNLIIPKPPASCPPPGITQLLNGVPICVFDPPIPSNLPRYLRAKAVARSGPRASGGQISKPSTLQRAINPTFAAGRPVVLAGCGCGEFPDA